jgi:hypothetical protein
MDLYVWSLLLGVVGLGAMAFTGLGSRGHSGGSHGHGGGRGHGHAGHGHAGHGHAHSHGHGHAQSGGHLAGIASRSFWTITSPRYQFSLALGFGTAGELLRPVLGGPLLVVAAALGAIVFERAIVSPLWNFTMRFASTPASTLESAITDEATAVTAFDQNGQGIVSLEVDGQVVQILATLRADDRMLPTRVRAGQRVRIEDVNVAKNSCTVSLI